MTLLWKLLRSHVSVVQLLAFFFANLLGMTIVLVAFQFYSDVRPAFSGDDGIMPANYLILHKPVSAVGKSQGFSREELDDLSSQPFVSRAAAFAASRYRVSCRVAVPGVSAFGTEMFFESVPDEFVDVKTDEWRFSSQGDRVVPIILPRSYLALYNFGFAQAQSLPQLTESVIGMLGMKVRMTGNGYDEELPARVVGFSNRLNTILVPASFLQWSNARFAAGEEIQPQRLIAEVTNPTDASLTSYLRRHDLQTDGGDEEASRLAMFLRVVVGIVIAVGLLISLLSFYMLMLSIYLLVQKNTQKLQTLQLIGYSAQRVSQPYWWLTCGINVLVCALSLLFVVLIRAAYFQQLWAIFPRLPQTSVFSVIMLAVGIAVAVCLCNVLIIYRKVRQVAH